MASELIERDLYNGVYRLVHNPNARGRQPRYVVNGVEKPKGVTTIMGATLAKDLMQWAADSACEYLRAKLPVVTEEDLKAAADAYKTKRDAGASTGSEAHAMVENFLKHQEQVGSPSVEAKKAYDAFKKWFEKVEPQVINVEEVIYSHTFKYAGTYDCMLQIGDQVMLCDLKTTNSSRKAPEGVYAENFVQLGAYAAAHEEQREYEENHGGTKLRKIDDLMVISAKKNGQLHTKTASELGLSLTDCMEMFRKTYNLWSFLGYTTKELGGK